jgi:hypothetical protein
MHEALQKESFRAKAVMRLLKVNMLFIIIGMVFVLSSFTLQGNHASEALIGLIGAASRGLLAVVVLIDVILGVFWCMWIHRAYKNLDLFGTEWLQHSPAWAVGSYFVPILNLWVPFRVMKELWCFSGQDPSLPAPALIANWWVLWIISNILNRVVFKLDFLFNFPSDLPFLVLLLIISAGVDIAATVAAYRVVRGVHDRQTERFQQIASTN